MESIYARYRTGNQSFSMTLELIQELISARSCRKVWVQGCNSGRSTLVFTIFGEGLYTWPLPDYRIETVSFGSFRQYRPIPVSDRPEDTALYETEIRLIEELIARLGTGPLSGVIS